MERREFIKGTAWMGAVAAASGCLAEGTGTGVESGGSMALYADKPFERLRVGVIGLGRGSAAFGNFPVIPGCEISAVCDLNAARIKRALDTVKRRGQKSAPKVYTGGPEEWKKLCDDPNVDLVYNATPWELHVPIALYAMNAGKHVATEVPSAFTVEECWELVNTSERLRRHCMQLENCCYGEAEMLALNLVKKGVLGEVVHGEGAYIHDLRGYNYGKWDDAKGGGGYWNYWRLRHNVQHKGDQYTTHGLGPVCQYMDINRGDRFDYLVSLESDQRNFEAYAKARFPKGSWQADLKVAMGDMNTMLVKTKRGRSIMIQHDVSSPRPYSRINRVTGTKGAFEGITFLDNHGRNADPKSVLHTDGCFCRFGWEEKVGGGVHSYFDDKKTEEMRRKYAHPLWAQSGELAKKMGGHGGMDFLMELRLAYCLQNGLPLDQNVYDLASWCCLCELSEKSVRNRSTSVDVPDFTRGAWETTPPLDIGAVDVEKMGARA
ncbi:MAG: Gfo/Idh/MocA family oxidoreductase [Kiritimatiellae bacterium]|nr:Gfo/Idh/MocA family oxidoreductase [Kiritimatiellia bacterium]